MLKCPQVVSVGVIWTDGILIEAGLGLFQTTRLGRVEPNWIKLDLSATLEQQLSQTSCYVWSCRPTLALCGCRSLWSAELWIKTWWINTEFGTSEALLKLDVWNHVAPKSCSTTTTSRFSRAVVELSWSVKFDMTLAHPKRDVWNGP